MAPRRRARMRRVRTVAQVRRVASAWRRAGEHVAFVPTMGAIHDGHLSLVRRARASAERVVVSIFVNPLQFVPGEDFGRYPRPRRRDRALLSAAGVDVLWEPAASELYAPDAVTRVRVLGIGDRLEGASRPGHFEGVATVVLKLLNVVRPDDLWLGQKDAQQARLIEQMCRDLFLDVRVKRGATHRERDGLARSSRNAYLTRPQRAEAIALSRGLRAARAALEHGERGAASIKREVRRVLRSHPLIREDYVAVVDAATLEPVARISRRVLIAVAARIGRARLIDNLEWQPRSRRGGA